MTRLSERAVSILTAAETAKPGFCRTEVYLADLISRISWGDADQRAAARAEANRLLIDGAAMQRKRDTRQRSIFSEV